MRFLIGFGAFALAACGGASSENPSSTGVATDDSGTRQVVKDYVGSLNLRGPIPPSGCEVLTEALAAEILGSDVRKKPGAPDQCTFVSGSGDSEQIVQLLITSFPLASFTVDDDLMKISLTLQGWSTIQNDFVAIDAFGDKPAFVTEEDGNSILFLVPGVNTTSVASGEPIGEVVVQAELKTNASHDDRIPALIELGEAAGAFLRK